ncbi:T9SS type A sorting domain-containing protein [Aquimarina longa]|uniref:T9SS type A sorting domain-containing protein n=1 Tax=Aquimarina longa TaxID=1080221 RepID=UPI0009E8D73A|nr:T9SS type A sorting domain-containing protein [Aquimarina longa]
MSINFFLVSLLFATINSYAQVTLKQHHFFSVGDTIVEYYNRLPQNPIDIGEPGENKVWDFSNLDAIAVNKQTIKFLAPKETPFYADYPDSNIVLYSNNGYETWSFMRVSTEKITNLGYGLFVNKEKRTGNYGGIDMSFPLKYLDKSSNETINERVLVKNKQGQDSIKVKTVSNHIYDIDAWGDVILPKGTFLSLRLKYTLNVTNYIYQKRADKWGLLVKPETKSTISYKWWTDDKNTKYPVVQIVMDDAHKKPIVVKYLEAIPFSEIINEVKEETIKVYPNPVKEKLFIEILAIEETYTTIYSIQGKIVKNLKTNISKIEIDVSAFSAGIYLIINRSKAGKIIGKSKFIKKM